MGIGGDFVSVNFSQLIAFQKKLLQLDKKIHNTVCRNVANGLASQLIKATKKRTPVGHYPKNAKDKDGNKKKGGTLRRNWKRKGEKIYGGYKVIVFNDVEYAPYVEYGHRRVKKSTKEVIGFVPGHHMLEKSIDEVRKTADIYASQKTEAITRRILGNWKMK